jgi:hypothetical protein
MTVLRQRMLEDMQIRNFSEHTQRANQTVGGDFPDLTAASTA